MGAIAVEILSTGETVRGFRAFEQLCLHLPGYRPLLWLARFNWLRSRVERETTGCDGVSCSVV